MADNVIRLDDEEYGRTVEGARKYLHDITTNEWQPFEYKDCVKALVILVRYLDKEVQHIGG